MFLNFKLTESGFSCLNPAAASVPGEVAYVKCNFTFTSAEWADVDVVVAVFKNATYNVSKSVVLDSNNSCFIDPDVFKNGGTVQVILYGDKYSSNSITITSHVSPVCEVVFTNRITLPAEVPSSSEQAYVLLSQLGDNITNLISAITAQLEDGDFDGVGIADISFTSTGNVIVTLTNGEVFVSTYSFMGPTGAPGTGISSIAYAQDGTITITLSDGTTSTSTYSMKGEAATIEIGTVTTGDAGSEASVTNLGTETDAILDFVIPRGADGADGAGPANLVDGAAPGSVRSVNSSASLNANAFAVGNNSTASGVASFAEGAGCTASGDYAHAEGYETEASGDYAHASGGATVASGRSSTAMGFCTVSDQVYQTAVGKYNTENNTDNLFVIGNGTSDSSRSDAFAVDTDGNVVLAGSITVGGVTLTGPAITQLLALI